MRVLAIAMVAAMFVAAAAAAAPTGERLVVKPYPGPPAWKLLIDKTGGDGFIHEQIPGNETEAGFTRILTDQGFTGMGGQDPTLFVQNVFASVREACDGVSVNGPTLKTEGGYKVAYAQVYCGQQHGEGFGVHVFYKVISGADALYSVSWEDHVPPSANGAQLGFPKGHEAEAAALVRAEAAADKFLAGDVYLCGGPSSDPRCRR